MAQERGTSVAPLVLGIIGAALQIPGSLCAGICAGAIEVATTDSQAAGDSVLAGTFWFGILAALLGLIGAFLGKKKPTVSGVALLLATLCSGVLVFMGAFMNFLVDGACLCFLIGGILAFTQKKEALVEQQS